VWNIWVPWAYGTLSVGVCMVLWNPGSAGPLGLRILSVPSGKTKNRGTCVFASHMVLRLFLESCGTFLVFQRCL
jgi:hypothetical protein